MFTITVISPDQVHMELNGTPNAEEMRAAMRAAIDDFLTKTQTIEHGNMLYRLDPMFGVAQQVQTWGLRE
ncbi:MAG: hypothetical protein ACPG5T_01920 [Endozoicomonas sp.]